MTREERMKRLAEEIMRTVADFEARVAVDFDLKQGPLTGACIHNYVQHVYVVVPVVTLHKDGKETILLSYKQCKYCADIR